MILRALSGFNGENIAFVTTACALKSDKMSLATNHLLKINESMTEMLNDS